MVFGIMVLIVFNYHMKIHLKTAVSS